MFQDHTIYQVPLTGQHIKAIIEALETKKRIDALELQKTGYALDVLSKFEYSDEKEATDKLSK